MNRRSIITLFFLLISIFSYSLPFETPGTGVTILVHGWNPNDKQPAWMLEMANSIICRAGGVGYIGVLTVTGNTGNLVTNCSNWNFDLANKTSGEIVIIVNWTAVSNYLTKPVTAQEVAAAITPKIYQSENGQKPLSELPIHLIGHSRGGGMVFEIARLLGIQGIEVEHVTSLDPHPITAKDPLNFNHTFDTPIQIYENILFADNYWQNIKFPKGHYINGAYNRLWTKLKGGYHKELGYSFGFLLNFSDHLNTILMYYGTINLSTPANNGEASMKLKERNTWFNNNENSGENTGFKYSRIIIGNRKSFKVTVEGGDTIIAGYNSNTILGGSGKRTPLSSTNAIWPNVITSSLYRNNSEVQPGFQTLTLGEVVQINYKYRSYSNASVATFYVDTDCNPYNNNNILTIDTQYLPASGSEISPSTINWTVSGLTGGKKYYIYSQISDGIHKRFLYINNKLCVSNDTL